MKLFLRYSILLFLFLGSFSNTKAQSSGDYRTIAPGAYNGTSVWQTFNGLFWINTISAPSNSAGAITILHSITIASGLSVNADQLTISTGGTLTINDGTLNLYNGAGNDLTISGGTLTISNALAAINAPSGSAVIVASSGAVNLSAGTLAAGLSFYNYNPTALNIVQSSGTTFTLNGALYNFSATSTWNAISSNFIIGSNGYFSVESGSTLNLIGSGNINIGSTSSAALSGSFAVFGTLTKTTNSTLNINASYFYNYGIFQLTTTASTVYINSGGWSVGTFAATIAGSAFRYEVSTKILYAGTTLSGSGTHTINAPIAYFPNGTSAFNFSSTINFNVPTDIPSWIYIASSVLNCNKGVTFEGPGYAIFKGNSQITNGASGSFSTTVNDTLSIQPTIGAAPGPSALTINSNISINGPMVTSASSVCQLNGTGTAYFSGNYLSNGGRILNTNFNFIGHTAQMVTGATGIIATAEIDNVNTVQFAANHTISTALNFTNGKVNIFYKLFMPGTASIGGYGNGKYFYGAGYLKRTLVPSTTYTYPVGTSSDFLPATLVTAATFVADTIWVKVEQSNFNSIYDSQLNALGNPVSTHVVDPVWHITESTAAGSAFTSIKLQWNATNEKYLFNRALCGIVRNSLGSWNAAVAGASTGSDPYTRTLATPTLASTKSELFGVADNSAAYINNYIVSNVQTRSVCAGASFSFYFYDGDSTNVGAANVFTAQLSNANGSFASPVNIGSVTARGGRLLSVTIPLGTAPGNYSIRVVSTVPVMTELKNYANYYNQRVSVQPLCYCGGNISSVSCSSAYISEVNINTLDRISTCDEISGTSYSSIGVEEYNSDGTYTPNTTYVRRGTTETIYVTTNVASIISVWIDYNKNGVYEASEWTQVTTSSVANQSSGIGIAIPAGASLGLTGMRVRSRLALNVNGAADACTIFGSGETEEYYVYITDNLAIQSLSPTTNNRCAVASISPSITFNSPIKTSSITKKNVQVQGNISGMKAGVLSGGNTSTINFNPTQNFEPGEVITMATSGTGIVDTAGQTANPYCFQFTTAAAVAPKTFKKHTVTGSGVSVVNSYSADFNNDGFVDILDVNSSSNNGYLSIYLGNGNGTFSSPTYINTGAIPYSAAIADYDMDGDMDIAVGYGAVYRVDVYYNSGTGTFNAPYTINTQHRPRLIIPFYVLDNEAPSIATANYGDSTVSIIQNYGNGVLVEKAIRKLGSPIQSIVAGDFNLNGLMDLAACGNDNKIVIMEFATRKTLTIRSIFSAHGTLPIDIKTADFNGDGDLDLVWSNFSSGTLGYVRGSTGITFDTANVTTISSSSFPYKISLGDFDGDCDIDISCTSANSADFNLFENNSGTFYNFGGPKGNSSAGYIVATAAADFDEDGDIDLVGSSVAYNSKTFLENASYSIQTGPISGPLCNTATFTVSWTVSDTLPSNNYFYIQLSNASGSFSNPTNIDSISGNFSGSKSVTISGISPGAGYRIRVISTLPSIIYYDNGTNIGIGLNPVSANISYSCSGNNTVLTASGATSYTWSPSNHLSSSTGATVTATMPFTGTILLTAKDAGGCPTTLTASIGTSCYCYPDYAQRDCSQDYLANLSFNTLNYTQNGCSGNDNNTTVHNYDSTNFTPGTTVNKLSSYNLSVTSSSSFQEGIGVWIDYNHDQDFADAGEFVYASPTITNQTYTSAITIPGTATTGITRMRVMTVYNTLVTATDYCNQTFAYGSTEDFNIYIDVCVPPSVITLSGGGTICSTQTSSVLLGSSTVGVNYALYKNAVPTGTILPGTGTVLTFSGLNQAGTYTVLATNSLGCTAFMSGSVNIVVNSIPTTAAAGSDQTKCGLTTATLAANAPTSGTGAWSIISGTGGSFSSTTNPVATFTGGAGITYTLRWTISNSPCTASTDDVIISFPLNPTTANAGLDQLNLCGLTSTALTANAPTSGTGAWSIVSGTGGSFSNAASPVSTFIGTAGTSYTLRWSITTTGCTPSTDDVIITFPKNPTPSNAGLSQTLCGATSTTLAANTPTVGSGAWTIFSGVGGSLGSATSPASTFTGVAGNTYVLFWTIANSPCASSADSMVVSFPKNPTTADAGTAQTLCGLSSTALAGNTPAVGTGAWSIVSGTGGSFGNSTSPTSTFNGVSGNTYTLRWTISNLPCTASSADVIISFPKNPTTANAGLDQLNLCGLTSATLAANTPPIGIGAWSVVSGTGGSFSNAASATSTFIGTAGTTYTLRWTISNSPCTASTDDVVIAFPKNPTTANAGASQTLCGATSTTLAGNTPIAGTGVWTIFSGTGGSLGTATSPSSTFSGTAGNTYVLFWTISNSPCTSSADSMVLSFPKNPTASVAGSAQTLCGLTSTSLAANTPTVGTGIWSIVSGSGGSFSNNASPISTFTGTAGNSYTLRWTISNSPCTASSSDVAISFPNNPTTAAAGPDQLALCGLTSATLAANAPSIGTGSWSIVSGTGGSFSNAASATSTFIGTAGTTYTLRWTISNAPCTATTDDVVIAFPQNPSTANAGASQTLCGSTSTILAGNTPTVGTGIWTIFSGTGGSLGNANSASSTFTGLAGNTYVLFWTITNSPCAASSDSMVIAFPKNPTIAAAGSDQTLCGATLATLAANTAAVGTGLWTKVTGTGGSFANSASPTSTFTGTAGNSYTLRWTISNSPCTASTDDVIINFPLIPTIASAGNDTNICNGSTINLKANTALVGTGAWSIAGGSCTISNAASPSSTANNFTNNTITSLVWSISNGVCATSRDTVKINSNASFCAATLADFNANATTTCTGNTVVFTDLSSNATSWSWNFGANATPATASSQGPHSVTYSTTGTKTVALIATGPGGSNTATKTNYITVLATPSTPTGGITGLTALCAGTTTVTYSILPLTFASSYVWTVPTGASIVSGAGTNTITVDFSTSAVSGNVSVYGTNICGNGGSVSAAVAVSPIPTVANAGTDQLNLCGTLSATLSANTPTIGTGAWSIVSGGTGSFSNAANSGAIFTGTAGSTYTLRWTISNGTCAPSSDDVIIKLNQNPTVAAAGLDQLNLCGVTSATLTGNTALIGSGLWTIVSGTGGSFTNASSPTSVFVGTAGNTYTLRWSISNAPCTTSSDDVVITFPLNPTTAAAGADQVLCGSTSTTLAANVPVAGTGAWTIVSGTGGSFSNSASAVSTFTGVAGSSYTLRWTISNVPCTASTDDVVISFPQNPTTAFAGNDQLTLCGTTTATLAATAATVGTGAWSIVSGGTGSFSNATSASSTFTGTAGNTYTLRWTVSNAPCSASTDDVVIIFNQNPTVAAAGADQINLCGLTSATLAGNTALIGTGQWTIVSGSGGSFTNASLATSVFVGTAGNTYTLRWTISNAPCTSTSDDVIISFPIPPTTAAAGADQLLCGTISTALVGNTPINGSGLWTIISGSGGSFSNANLATSTFNGTAGTAYTLRWTISNAPCAASSDDVLIAFPQNPSLANAGPDQLNLCGTTTATLAANTPSVGTGAWTIISGGTGSFLAATSATSNFTGTAGSTYTLRWTISSAPCSSSSDDVVISFNQNPTAANAGVDQINLCGLNSATLAGNSAVIGTGLWTIISGAGGSLASPTSPTSVFVGNPGSTYTLRWSISNSPCVTSTDDVIITFPLNPTTAAAGADQVLCGSTTATLAANTALVGTGNWSIISGAGGSILSANSAVSTFTGIAGTTYTLRWTISNSPCTASSDDVLISFPQNPSTAIAGVDQLNLCGTSIATLAANTPSVGTGAWSIVTGGTGSFSNATSANSTFTGTAGSSYTMRWTISNSPCTSTSDDVVVSFNQNPTIAAAGADQISLCGLTSATLGANAPLIGTGLWTVVSGSGGSFANASLPSSVFVGNAGASYTLRWTISNATCTSSSDDVIISFPLNPTTAAAGADQTICGAVTATMAANTAIAGTGAWSIVSGSGGSFANVSLPASTFTGTAGNTYTLRWTISNSPCGSSSDDVVLSFPLNPSVANAGADQLNLCGASTATLSATAATAGTGVWTIVSGGSGTFSNASSAGSTFTGIAGSTYTLRWTVSNSICTPSSDDVLIAFPQIPTVANAGADQSLCGSTSLNLSANVAIVGNGNWTIVSGTGGSFSSTTNPLATFSGVAGNTYTLRWSISNSPCTVSSDDVIISFLQLPSTAFAGNDTTICNGSSISLSANVPQIGNGQWSVISGATTFGALNSANSTASSFPADSSTVLMWTVTAGNTCPDSHDTLVVTSNTSVCIVTLADFIADTTKTCINSAVVFTDASNQATSWFWDFGAGATPATATTVGPHTVSYSSSGFKTVSLSVSGPGGTDTKTKTGYVEILQLPGAAATISGVTTLCEGQTNIPYTVAAIADADVYNWVLPNGASINSFNQNVISVDFAIGAGSGNISVDGSNICGTGASSTLAVAVNYFPAAAGTINGQDTICASSSNVNFNLPSIANASSYEWILSSGISATSTSTIIPQIAVDLSAGINYGTIQVFGHNTCGNGDTSAIFSFYVAPYPDAAGSILGSTTVSTCSNQLGITYTVAPINNASGYNWILPPLTSIVNGANSNSIIVNYDVNSSSGSIVVNGTNNCGAGSTSSLAVNFMPIPATEICYATVDSATVQSILYWQRPLETYVDSFIIYSDPTGGNNLTRLAAVKDTATIPTFFIDPSSNPLINAVTYQIATIDSCHNQLSLSATIVHKTINLNGFIGWSGAAKLYWNEYLGISDPGRYYSVLRDTIGNGPFDDTLASHILPGSSLFYTDATSFLHPNCRYVIVMEFSTSCDPTQKIMLNKSTSRSNIKNRSAMGPDMVNDITADNWVKVFPNPAKGNVNVEIAGVDKDYTIILTDLLGQNLWSKEIKPINSVRTKTEIPLLNIAPGIYFVTVESAEYGKRITKLKVE